MSGRAKGIGDRIVERGTRLLSRAAEAVMRDPRGQEAVARAVGAAQRGRKRLEALEERVLHAVGLPARPDFDAVAKRMAHLKRQLRDLKKALDEKERWR